MSYETMGVSNLEAAPIFENLVYGLENLECGKCLTERQEGSFSKVGFMIDNEDSLEVYCNYSDVMKESMEYSHEIEARLIDVFREKNIENMNRNDMVSCIDGFKKLANKYWLRAQGIY